MNIKGLLQACIFTLLFACNNIKDDTNTTDNAPGPNESAKQNKVIDIEPQLWKADKLQVIYYDDPDGDSLRYSRFYSFVEISDTNKVKVLLKEMDQTFVQQDKTMDCRSEGKVFLLNKDDVLKTVYFSTRGDSCSYMYFIKNGLFFYFKLSNNAKRFYNTAKLLAKKPIRK